MIALERRRGQIYCGPAALIDADGNPVSAGASSADLLAGLNGFTFQDALSDGDEASLDGQVIARWADGKFVAS